MTFLSKQYLAVKVTQNKGKGLFAKKNISPGTVIGDYLGKVIKTADFDVNLDKQNDYLMYYHDYASIYPDLKKPGVHLINHSCAPNCWMYTLKGHTLFFALRHIFPGEELTISYLLSPKDEFCNPCTHECQCESIICTGTMHLPSEKYKKWREFQDSKAKKDKRAKIRFNNNLPPLPSYPLTISDNPVYDLFGNPQKPPKTRNSKMLPSRTEIRKIIRETGRILDFPKLNTTIYGIVDNHLVSDNIIDSHGRSPWSSLSTLRGDESEASPTARSRGLRLLEIK